jgi:hypothetical protein
VSAPLDVVTPQQLPVVIDPLSSACHSARSSYSLDFTLRRSPGLTAALPVTLLQSLENGPQVRVQLATRSVPTPAAGAWLAAGVLR